MGYRQLIGSTISTDSVYQFKPESTNLPRLDHYLDKLREKEDLSTYRKFHCMLWRFGRIERDENHRHFVSRGTYADRRFPAYCSGSAYILSTHISKVEYKIEATFNRYKI